MYHITTKQAASSTEDNTRETEKWWTRLGWTSINDLQYWSIVLTSSSVSQIYGNTSVAISRVCSPFGCEQSYLPCLCCHIKFTHFLVVKLDYIMGFITPWTLSVKGYPAAAWSHAHLWEPLMPVDQNNSISSKCFGEFEPCCVCTRHLNARVMWLIVSV